MVESREQQAQVFKTGSDHSTASRSTGGNILGQGDHILNRNPVLQGVWHDKEPSLFNAHKHQAFHR